MIKSLIVGIFALLGLTAAVINAQAQPILVEMTTTVGDYTLRMDSNDIYISQLDIFTNISFVYNTDRSLFPPPDAEKVTFESFAVMFATILPMQDAMQVHVGGDSIVRELQESTLFLSGFDTAFPYAEYNGNIDFNVLSMNVSAVPLPASAPMFAAAVVGLGAAGYMAKRLNRSQPAG